VTPASTGIDIAASPTTKRVLGKKTGFWSLDRSMFVSLQRPRIDETPELLCVRRADGERRWARRSRAQGNPASAGTEPWVRATRVNIGRLTASRRIDSRQQSPHAQFRQSSRGARRISAAVRCTCGDDPPAVLRRNYRARRAGLGSHLAGPYPETRLVWSLLAFGSQLAQVFPTACALRHRASVLRRSARLRLTRIKRKDRPIATSAIAGCRQRLPSACGRATCALPRAGASPPRRASRTATSRPISALCRK